MDNSRDSDAPVCALTGGSSGIGLATCLKFANEGYRIATCGRVASRLEAAVDQIRKVSGDATRVVSLVADVGHDQEARNFIDFAIAQWGRIDVLVNNAGRAPLATIADISPDDFAQAVAVNLSAVYATIQAVWSSMRQDGGGIIVNISSMAAVDPFPGLGMYGCCKAAVEALTRAVADEGKRDHIRAFCVRPGAVETPLLRSLFPDFPADQALQPQEIADLVWRLCSPEMAHCSGQAFEARK